MSIQQISFDEACHKFYQDFVKHSKEVAVHTFGDAADLNIDFQSYELMEDHGNFAGFVIKSDLTNIDIGYISILMYNHPHHSHIKIAMTDCFYINPKYRGYRSFFMILNAFRKIEKLLREKYKVDYMFLGTRFHKDLSMLAMMLDFAPSEVVYSKKLQET